MYRQWSLHVPPVVRYVPPVVTTCTAQWPQYVPHSGHYTYRQWSLYVPPAATLCTASGHEMYRQWSLYVLHTDHYMYRPVVTICTAQWSIYVQHSFHYGYSTAGLTFSNSTFCPHSGFENKQPLFPYTALTDWFCNRGGERLLRGTDWIFFHMASWKGTECRVQSRSQSTWD